MIDTSLSAPVPLVWYYLPQGNMLVRISDKGVEAFDHFPGDVMHYKDIHNTQQIMLSPHSWGMMLKYGADSFLLKEVVPIDLAEKLDRRCARNSSRYVDFVGQVVEHTVADEIVSWVKTGCGQM